MDPLAEQHPVRAAILEHLRDQGEAYAAQLARALEIEPGTIATHLRALADAGTVEEDRIEQRRGTWVRYYRPAREPSPAASTAEGQDAQLVDQLGALIGELTRLRARETDGDDVIVEALIENLDVARLTLTAPNGPPGDWQERAARNAERFLASRRR